MKQSHHFACEAQQLPQEESVKRPSKESLRGCISHSTWLTGRGNNPFWFLRSPRMEETLDELEWPGSADWGEAHFRVLSPPHQAVLSILTLNLDTARGPTGEELVPHLSLFGCQRSRSSSRASDRPTSYNWRFLGG